MPRRVLDPPPVDRVAAILGIAPVASSSAGLMPPAGWVPQRSSMARPLAGPRPAVAPEAVALEAVALEAVALEAVALEAVALEAVVREAVVREAVVREAVVREAVPPVATHTRAGSVSAWESPDLGEDVRRGRPGAAKPSILTVPVALRGLRARPRRMAVLGVLVLLVVVGVVLGVRVAWARSAARPEPISASHGPPAGLVARTVPAAFATTGPPGSPGSHTATVTAAAALLVHVVGQVRHPGVVSLPAGSRVLDAVRAAGGARPSADLSAINLARVVADGEQVMVPKPGQLVVGGTGPAGAGTGSTAQGSTGGATSGALVDLNTADASALDSLPGVGPVLSQRILDWRLAHGRFSSVDELGEVSGIGDKLLAQIRPKVSV